MTIWQDYASLTPQAQADVVGGLIFVVGVAAVIVIAITAILKGR